MDKSEVREYSLTKKIGIPTDQKATYVDVDVDVEAAVLGESPLTIEDADFVKASERSAALDRREVSFDLGVDSDSRQQQQ